jgi:hypothetical protein
MKSVFFIPIYEWGEESNTTHGSSFGTTIYSELQDLYGFEPDAIAHFEVSGELPTEGEFIVMNKEDK